MYLWWRDFLDDSELAAVKQATLDNRDKFVPTTVSTGEPDYRKSSVLWHYHFIELFESFTAKLKALMPVVKRDLHMEFEVDSIELQMTRSGDGEYFKQHIDNGTADTDRRRITYVYYYLLSEHRMFSGGDLMLRLPSGNVSITPNHNSIIWFPSELWHEVAPVTCSTGKFEDGRLTLNGWVRS